MKYGTLVFTIIFLVISSMAFGISGSLSPQTEEEGLFSLSNGASFYVRAIGLNGNTCDYLITYSGYERETDNLNNGCSFIYKYGGGKAILTHNGFSNNKCQFNLREYGGTAEQWTITCSEDCSTCSNICPCDDDEEEIGCNECEYTGYDCSGNSLYSCSYSGDCIIRELIDVCGGNEYCDVSTGSCKSVSLPDCPYECCKNINAYEDKYCSSGYSCDSNICVKDCEEKDEKRCYGGNVYWYDSCDSRGQLYDSCSSTQTCTEGRCVSSVISHYSRKCYNGDVYWYDNTGVREEILDNCDSNEECTGGYCKFYASPCPYECCQNEEDFSDKNCKSGYTCKNHLCQENKITCPYECCQNEGNYYEKNCASGNTCNNHVCKVVKTICPYECCEEEYKYSDKSCEDGYQCTSNKCSIVISQSQDKEPIKPIEEIKTSKNYEKRVYEVDSTIDEEKIIYIDEDYGFIVYGSGFNQQKATYELAYFDTSIGFGEKNRKEFELEKGCSYVYKYPGYKALFTHLGVDDFGKQSFSIIKYTGNVEVGGIICSNVCSDCKNTCPCENEENQCVSGGMCNDNYKYFINADCSETEKIYCENGCKEGACIKNREMSKYPIIFVHGWTGDATESFIDMQLQLVKDGLIESKGVLNVGDLKTDTCKNSWNNKAISVNYEYYDNEFEGGLLKSEDVGIEVYAKRLDEAVKLVKECTGAEKVNLIAHSMGGLVARQYLSNPDYNAGASVAKLITLATPHYGGKDEFFIFRPEIKKSIGTDFTELDPNSEFIKQLNQNQKDYKWNIISIISKADELVNVDSGLLEGSKKYLLDMDCVHGKSSALLWYGVLNEFPEITSPDCKEAYNIILDSISTVHYTNDQGFNEKLIDENLSSESSSQSILTKLLNQEESKISIWKPWTWFNLFR